jgi:hypothetical protein
VGSDGHRRSNGPKPTPGENRRIGACGVGRAGLCSSGISVGESAGSGAHRRKVLERLGQQQRIANRSRDRQSAFAQGKCFADIAARHLESLDAEQRLDELHVAAYAVAERERVVVRLFHAWIDHRRHARQRRTDLQPDIQLSTVTVGAGRQPLEVLERFQGIAVRFVIGAAAQRRHGRGFEVRDRAIRIVRSFEVRREFGGDSLMLRPERAFER